MTDTRRLIADTRAYACLDCGKCTSACPVSRYDADYSPRKLVSSAVSGRDPDLRKNGQLWSCLTCSLCESRCQSGVKYTDLIRSLRAQAYSQGETGQCTHGGALESMMRLMTRDDLQQDRMGWLDGDLKVAVESDDLYFTGCAPYFDVIFADLGVKTLDTARGAVKLLNRIGITPAVSPNERCCGHDLLWTGDVESFKKLALLNLSEIKKSKAKRVITVCPECYHALKFDYPTYLGETGFEVVHISEVLVKAIKENKLKFKDSVAKVTYHDPCRLGRFAGIYDAPRAVIDSISGVNRIEMPHNRSGALCCGTQAWINCGSVNKQIQTERLHEAAATGASIMLTSCPKCQIHLACALKGDKSGDLKIKILDLTSFAADSLTREDMHEG